MIRIRTSAGFPVPDMRKWLTVSASDRVPPPEIYSRGPAGSGGPETGGQSSIHPFADSPLASDFFRTRNQWSRLPASRPRDPSVLAKAPD